MVATKWQPGQSGNPSGRRGEYFEALKIFRDASPRAAEIIVAHMESEDQRLSLIAAQTVQQRAWGHPKDYDPMQDRDPLKPKIDITRLSRSERDTLEALLRKAMVQLPQATATDEAGNPIATEMLPPESAEA
jgi:hypothetical protein